MFSQAGFMRCNVRYNFERECLCKPTNCEHALRYSMSSYAHVHMNSFIFQVNTPGILGMVLEFQICFCRFSLISYCNGEKVMFTYMYIFKYIYKAFCILLQPLMWTVSLHLVCLLLECDV